MQVRVLLPAPLQSGADEMPAFFCFLTYIRGTLFRSFLYKARNSRTKRHKKAGRQEPIKTTSLRKPAPEEVCNLKFPKFAILPLKKAKQNERSPGKEGAFENQAFRIGPEEKSSGRRTLKRPRNGEGKMVFTICGCRRMANIYFKFPFTFLRAFFVSYAYSNVKMSRKEKSFLNLR